MPVIKKFGETLTQPLSSFATFLVDENPNSDYFRITEFKDTLTGGKNGFLIEGSEHLKESTEVKIQVLDVNGDPIYWEVGNGIPEYYEGISKVISLHIYEDTPIGEARIVILGELKTYLENGKVVRDVPDEWKGVYNVKWEKTFKVNKLLSNSDKVRFYRRPLVNITEIAKPIFSTTVSNVQQNGIISGVPITPVAGTNLSNYTSPTFYKLEIQDNTNWTGSIEGATINVPSLNYTPTVVDVINNKELLVREPYTSQNIVESFENLPYSSSFNYVEGIANLKTALTGSFAKINITDLTTFVGDVVRVKVFRKSQSTVSDYQFVEEIQLESNELLVDLESQNSNLELYGNFSDNLYKTYWVSSSNNLTTTFNQNYLYNSIRLDSTSGTNYFFTTKSLDINEDVEYTLGLNVRLDNNSASTSQLRVFLSGSTQNIVNGNIVNVGNEQDIVTYTGTDKSLYQKTTNTINFKASQLSNAKIYFEVKGSGWHISQISLKASQESSFSPDEITFIQPVPRNLEIETFDYKFQFYDINNNYIPVDVSATKTFNGGNLQRIEKKLNLNPTSLYFQFDSGSQPVPPTVITFNIQKTLLTGSVNFTSSSIDFFGNNLSASQYVGGVFPGTLDLTNPDVPVLTVARFTGSRSDIDVQLVTFTGECEGVTDTVTITAVLDGFGGVNHFIKPYRGTQIRNSSTQSLEIQAVRIDGINSIELYSGSRPDRGWNLIQFHVLSGSAPFEKFVNLQYASASGFIQGLTPGVLGTREINFNATFNRDSIDKRRTVYLMSSASAASNWASITSASVLASQILEDLQDGLDTPVVTYNTDTFTINFKNETQFRPVSASATASFYIRGTNENPISASILVYPSMSLNRDFVPEYWMYWVSQSKDSTISITAADERGRNIPARLPSSFVGNPLSQSKVLVATFTYTEPYTLTEISIDKTFTIVPEGRPGDESIVFELVPANLTLNADAKGNISTYVPANTEIKLKQGANYLSFSSSKAPGTFFLNDITQSYIVSGAVNYTNTSSLLITSMSNMTQLSASLTYNLLIHPFFTSSRYTQSLVQNFTKALDGAPPLEVILNPLNVTLNADEVGWVKSYERANTTVQIREGNDFLTYSTSSIEPGTWRFIQVSGSNIRTGSLIRGNNTTTASLDFNNFTVRTSLDNIITSASVNYTILTYPYSLFPGHVTGSKILTTRQNITKSPDAVKPRSVSLSADSSVVNFDSDGIVISPEGAITLIATPINYTSSIGSVYYQFFKDGEPQDVISTTNEYLVTTDIATAPGETTVWKVEMRDGSSTDIVRASSEITIAGIKAGADAFNSFLTNQNSSIQVDLWGTAFSGSGTTISADKNGVPLIHIVNQYASASYNSSTGLGKAYYEHGNRYGEYIGNLGYYSASVHSYSPWITLASPTKLTGVRASIPDISAWSRPAISSSAVIVYKVDFEEGRATQFHSQSLGVQFVPPPPYDVKLQNDSSGVVYRVSGEIEFEGTSNVIRAYRGDTELTAVTSFSSPQLDAYGQLGYKNQVKVSIYSKSDWISLAGGLSAPNVLPVVSNIAQIGNIVSWTSPETNATGEIVYKIECEGRQTLLKTQSLSIQYEGNTGPGLVMRGEWTGSINYIGSHETTDYRRDVVTYLATKNSTKYYAALSGSGPQTYKLTSTKPHTFYVGSTPPVGYTLIGPQQPVANSTTEYWQYLGEQDFFVAAKLAIFEESYVKNTLNVGTVGGTGAFANIVVAGGRTDPYIAVGQTGTAGDSGDQTSNGVIGYARPGIFLGVYEGGASTSGRFSIVSSGGSGTRGLFWDGSNLIIKGTITQTSEGSNVGRLMGAWASGVQYYENDIVTYSGNTWTSNTSHVSTNNTNGTTGYPGFGPWTIAPVAAKTLRLSASSQVFIELKTGDVTPNYIEFIASKQNISATTNWTTSPSVTLYDSSTGGSVTTTGNTVYLRKADFGSNTSVSVTATADGVSDVVTIARVQEGTDGLTIILDNESHTLVADSSGTVEASSYNDSGTTITLFEGAEVLDYDGVGTAAGKWTVSASGTNITAGSPISSVGTEPPGRSAVVPNHSNMTADQASVELTITGKKINGDSFTITKYQSLTKSKQGAAGANGANGTDGAPGPGVVFRGEWSSGSITYLRDPAAPTAATRRDVVRYSTNTTNPFWLCKVTHVSDSAKNPPTSGNTENTYWAPFGATFSSVATDILLAQDATVTRGLVLGTEGSFNGFLRSANATSLLSGQGFYLDVNGRMRFGQQVSGSNKYVYFDGTDLNINATVNAPDGNIGGFTIANNKLIASGALLILDTQIPQIEVYKAGDTGSAKVVINSSANLTDPGAGTTYVSESTWAGTTGTTNSGTTFPGDTYVIQYYRGGLGVTTNGSGDPQSIVSLTAGATEFSVFIPETSLTITVGTISTTTAYPPDPPTFPYEDYLSRYAVPRSAEGEYYVELWDITGTTKIAEAVVNGTYHYRQGGYSYTYYAAGGSYPLTWGGPYTFTQGATYSGNIAAGYRTGNITVPATAQYKVRLAYRQRVASGLVVDYVNNTETYYSNSASNGHAETGFIYFLNFYFKPNFNKTEITNGGIQVISNQEAFFKVNRIDPAGYGFSSYIVQSKGGIVDLNGGGATLFDKWNASCLSVYGAMYGVGVLEIGAGGTNITNGTMFKVNGGTTKEAVFQVGVVPDADNTYTLGKSGKRWTQVWAATGTIQTSDVTQKFDVESSDLGLDFINKLNPVSYKFISGSAIFEENEIKVITKKIKDEVILEDGTIIEPAEYKEVPNPEQFKIVGWNPGTRKHYGLIAQDVKNTLDELNISTTDFAGYIEGNLDNHTDLGLRYEEFIGPIIKSIQQLSQKVSHLEAKISGSL